VGILFLHLRLFGVLCWFVCVGLLFPLNNPLIAAGCFATSPLLLRKKKKKKRKKKEAHQRLAGCFATSPPFASPSGDGSMILT
jgi:hypothetical protein